MYYFIYLPYHILMVSKNISYIYYFQFYIKKLESILILNNINNNRNSNNDKTI